jgi:glucose-1-phosphate cytidylyltransferase
MKIIILCGGEGTRLKEETEFRPKPLVEVGGRPIVWHIMKIYSHYGFNDFILALGYKGEMISNYFAGGKNQDGFKVTCVDTGLKSLTGERIRQVANLLDGEEFMVTYGDGVANINIKKLLEFHKSQKTVGTITGVHPATRFGLIEKDDATKKIKGFHQVTIVSMSRDSGNVQEVRHIPSKDYINGGFMVFKKDFLNYLKPDSMLEEAFVPLIEKQELSVFEHEGPWKAMDTYKDVEELNLFWEKYPFWKVW